MIGGSRVLISYAVRESNELNTKPSIDDPGIAYATHDAEMVKRATIFAAGNPLGIEEDGPFDDSFVSNREKL